MPWAKLDDGFWRNPKVMAASLEATGLFARSLAYCGDQLTDGHVPAKVAAILADGRRRPITELVERGLWRPNGDGFDVHDYLDYNPSAAAVKRRRERDADRLRRWRNRDM
jgi:hypothetical protein